MKELQQTVVQVLEESERARANDNYLIWKVYRKMGWSTDLKEISKDAEYKFGSITRYRRKAQQTNPLLLPKKQVTRRRKARELKFKEMAKGL